MKKPVGSQHSFSNLDGARASTDSADRLSISSERPEEVEPVDADEEEGTVFSLAARTKYLATLYDCTSSGIVMPKGPWCSSEEEEEEEEEGRKKEEEKEEKEEESYTTDPIDPLPTLGLSRNSADPEVTTEPSYEDRCLRPLQRARERRAARLQKENDAHAVTNFDPHDSASERSSASCNLEQDRPQLQCCGCNNILTESDLSSVDDLNQSLKRAGLSRLAETEDAPACAACLNHWSL